MVVAHMMWHYPKEMKTTYVVVSIYSLVWSCWARNAVFFLILAMIVRRSIWVNILEERKKCYVHMHMPHPIRLFDALSTYIYTVYS